jgi:hypothetical protein
VSRSKLVMAVRTRDIEWQVKVDKFTGTLTSSVIAICESLRRLVARTQVVEKPGYWVPVAMGGKPSHGPGSK